MPLFSEWWNSTGKAKFADFAQDIGAGIGTGLKVGVMTMLGIDIGETLDEGVSINNPLPILAAPLPMLMNGVAILLSITAEKIEDKSGASPPGNSLPALESRLLNPCHNFSDTASKSKPSEKPFAKDAPILTPSSRVHL